MSKVILIQGTACYEHQCGTCGVWFALPDIIYDTAYREGGFFSCPNGHSRGWDKGNCESAVDSLRRDRDRLAQRQAQLQDEIRAERDRTAAAERREAAQKANVTKLKKRAGAGICPCCSRQFTDLKRHMAAKHPNYSDTVRKEPLKVLKGGKAE